MLYSSMWMFCCFTFSVTFPIFFIRSVLTNRNRACCYELGYINTKFLSKKTKRKYVNLLPINNIYWLILYWTQNSLGACGQVHAGCWTPIIWAIKEAGFWTSRLCAVTGGSCDYIENTEVSLQIKRCQIWKSNVFCQRGLFFCCLVLQFNFKLRTWACCIIVPVYSVFWCLPCWDSETGESFGWFLQFLTWVLVAFLLGSEELQSSLTDNQAFLVNFYVLSWHSCTGFMKFFFNHMVKCFCLCFLSFLSLFLFPLIQGWLPQHTIPRVFGNIKVGCSCVFIFCILQLTLLVHCLIPQEQRLLPFFVVGDGYWVLRVSAFIVLPYNIACCHRCL